MKNFFNLILLLFIYNSSVAQQTGVVVAPLVTSSRGIWQTNNINVCWENPTPANAASREVVRRAIADTWQLESNMNFLGWGACQPNSAGIRIKIDDTAWPHVKKLGSELNGLRDGMVLNFNWSGCGSPATDPTYCNRVIAIHEFGHALGFAHEHNRDDCRCDQQPQGTNGDWALTPCDLNSIMNYCNPAYNNNGRLSGHDINGVRALYGARSGRVEFTDESGKVTVAIFNKTSDVRRQHGRMEIPVPPDFIVVGGGAVASRDGKGALLTASFPNEQLSSWVVASKDHQEPHHHYLQGYAIGIKVRGMTREQLRSFISVNRVVSEARNHPSARATVAAGNVLIGGGFEVLWTGPGNLATASYPIGNSWEVKSKDHFVPDVARIVAYSIGINPNLSVGRIRTTVQQAVSRQASHPQQSINVPLGYALTCGGGFVSWTGEGSMLWQLEPKIDRRAMVQSFSTGAKDHIRPSAGTVNTFVLGLKIE